MLGFFINPPRSSSRRRSGASESNISSISIGNKKYWAEQYLPGEKIRNPVITHHHQPASSSSIGTQKTSALPFSGCQNKWLTKYLCSCLPPSVSLALSRRPFSLNQIHNSERTVNVISYLLQQLSLPHLNHPSIRQSSLRGSQQSAHVRRRWLENMKASGVLKNKLFSLH